MFGLSRGQRPRFEGSETHERNLIDRAESVGTVVELLKSDPAWRGADDNARRHVARQFLALCWAVRNQRRGVGDTGR